MSLIRSLNSTCRGVSGCDGLRCNGPGYYYFSWVIESSNFQNQAWRPADRCPQQCFSLRLSSPQHSLCSTLISVHFHFRLMVISHIHPVGPWINGSDSRVEARSAGSGSSHHQPRLGRSAGSVCSPSTWIIWLNTFGPWVVSCSPPELVSEQDFKLKLSNFLRFTLGSGPHKVHLVAVLERLVISQNFHLVYFYLYFSYQILAGVQFIWLTFTFTRVIFTDVVFTFALCSDFRLPDVCFCRCMMSWHCDVTVSGVSGVSGCIHSRTNSSCCWNLDCFVILCGDRIDFTSLYLCVFKTFEDVVLSSVMNIWHFLSRTINRGYRCCSSRFLNTLLALIWLTKQKIPLWVWTCGELVEWFPAGRQSEWLPLRPANWPSALVFWTPSPCQSIFCSPRCYQ